MKMHKTFTHIPERSFDAMFVRERDWNGRLMLRPLMAALSVDPLEAEDAFKDLGSSRIPNSLEYFASRSHAALRVALETIAQWVMFETDLRYLSELLGMYDRVLASWCASQAARSVLRFVSRSEKRPAKAVELTEAWVVGSATTKECEDMHESMKDVRFEMLERDIAEGRGINVAGSTAAAAAIEALSSAKGSYVGAYLALGSYLVDCATVVASSKDSSDRARAEKAVRRTVAKACLSYPVLPG